MNLGIILIFAAALAPPAPSPTPQAADLCGGTTTNLLAALNRPTIGFSACAVKAHESVWELGYNAVQQSDGTRSAVYPQGFIRFGAARGLELDFIGPNYLVQNAAGSITRGFADSGAGAKYEFFHDDADVMAFDLLYLVPSGAPAFTAGAPVATLNFDYGRSLSPAAGFATTIGVLSSFSAAANGASSRFASLVPSVAFTIQSNPRTQFYTEAFGQTPIRPDGGTLFGLDGGLQFLLAPNLEMDAEFGQTATDVARSRYFGVGLGLRL